VLLALRQQSRALGADRSGVTAAKMISAGVELLSEKAAFGRP